MSKSSDAQIQVLSFMNIKKLTAFALFTILISSTAFSQDSADLMAEVSPAVESASPKASNDKPAASIPMTNPQFPGGAQGIQNYLAGSVSYPAIAMEYGIEGKVVVMATVAENGRITDAKVIKGIIDSCDQEALSAVQQMPLWAPGTKNGEPVSSRVMLEIKFSLR